jgi:hypothetical protein
VCATEGYTPHVKVFERVARAATKKSGDLGRTTHPLAHLLYWLLPIISALPLFAAWIGFSFVIAGVPPDGEMNWDNEKHAVVFLALSLGPYFGPAIFWTALGLFVYLLFKAPEVRIRVPIWFCLLVASGVADYDRRHPVTERWWMLRGSAAFLLAALAALLPIVWSGLLLRRQLARRSPMPS